MYLFLRRESQLIQDIKRGGPAGRRAQEYLYKNRNFHGLGIEKVRILGGTTDDGLSVMHEAFTTLVDNIQSDRYQDRNNLKAYFLRIVKNKWVDRLRKKRKEYLVPEPHQQEDDAPNPELQLINNEISQLLKELLDQLDEVCRTILCMDIEGYNHEEIAAELGWENHKRVRDRKYKCRKRNREKNADQYAYLQQLLNRKNGQ